MRHFWSVVASRLCEQDIRICKMQSCLCGVSADSRMSFQFTAHFLQLAQRWALRCIKAETQETSPSRLMLQQAERKPSLLSGLLTRPLTRGEPIRSAAGWAEEKGETGRQTDRQERRLLTVCQTQSGLCRSELHLELKERDCGHRHFKDIMKDVFSN